MEKSRRHISLVWEDNQKRFLVIFLQSGLWHHGEVQETQLTGVKSQGEKLFPQYSYSLGFGTTERQNSRRHIVLVWEDKQRSFVVIFLQSKLCHNRVTEIKETHISGVRGQAGKYFTSEGIDTRDILPGHISIHFCEKPSSENLKWYYELIFIIMSFLPVLYFTAYHYQMLVCQTFSKYIYSTVNVFCYIL